jgi:eukaryotic-like serine/threonine-protein kinase
MQLSHGGVSMADRVGQQLGNYRLTRLIGQGGFAEVYLGEHIYLKTLVAIKLLRTTVANPDILESFLKEAQTIAHLLHPNIVRVMDFGVDGETPYLVMDYAVNGTLRQRHAKGTQLPLATIVPYVNQVAAALQHAHNEKLIHRDVKPENMLLGRYNDVLLSDFGIALIAQSSLYQSTQDVIGTIAYMSPEQIQGKPRPASDQYSLGIVVYEWLSGDRPFHGSFAELCTQHLFASPAPLREKVSTLAPVVEEVVLTVLAKDSHHRFGSVQAFAHALEQAYQSEHARSAAPTVQATMPPLGVSPMGETQLSSLVPIPEPPVQPTKEASPSRFAPTRQASPDTGREPTVPVAFTTENPPIPVASVPEMISTPSTPSLPFFTKAPVVTPSLQTVLPSKRGIPRRTVVVGLAGLVVVGIAGSGIVWLTHSQQSSIPAAPPLPSTSLPIGTTLYTYRGHSSGVFAVAWSPDGKRLASGSQDKTVQVWDATDGGHVFTYRGHSSYVYAVAWSPDGRRLASGSLDKTVQVWSAE